MILYFSATGNSLHVAREIAKQTGDALYKVDGCLKEGRLHFDLKEGEALGIICPTFHWGLPSIVLEYMEKLSVNAPGKPYIFFVSTCGAVSGRSGKVLSQLLEAKELTLSASFTVQMANSWTPMANHTNPNKALAKNAAAEPVIKRIAKQIKERVTGDHLKGKMPAFATRIMRKMYEDSRQTSHFRVLDRCISCGLCEKKCPEETIKMTAGKPVWVKERCCLCLGCLHRCPVFAIQYGKNTEKHGQYLHPQAAK